jgi:hypothetical protein
MKEMPMKVRYAWGVLAAAATLLVSGAAFSGNASTSVDELMDFDTATGELWAYPSGAPLATYIHTTTTQHLVADLSTFLPPDPCIPLAVGWNFVVRFDARFHVRSTFVFERLLTTMSAFRCHAAVTAPTGSGSTPPIISVGPTGS